MPVLIVGASCDIGRRLAAMLAADGAQVRVYISEEDSALREAGCKVALGDYDQVGRLESAMEQVHTVAMLVGGPEPPASRSVEWWNEEAASCAMIAAVGAGVRRFLYCSDAGADAASSNPSLRSRGIAEDVVLAEARLEAAVLACAPVLGDDTPLGRMLAAARARRTPVAPSPGTQRLNPVWSGDVAAALARADARDAEVRGAWTLGGPDVVTFDELVHRATGRDRVAHRRRVPGVPSHVAEAWSVDRVADSTRFLAQFPMMPTPLREALDRLGRAGA